MICVHGIGKRTNGGSYRRVKSHGGAVLGIGAIHNRAPNSRRLAQHGPEALRHGERPDWDLRSRPARVQRAADAAARVDTVAADDAATAANPAEERRRIDRSLYFAECDLHRFQKNVTLDTLPNPVEAPDRPKLSALLLFRAPRAVLPDRHKPGSSFDRLKVHDDLLFNMGHPNQSPIDFPWQF